MPFHRKGLLNEEIQRLLFYDSDEQGDSSDEDSSASPEADVEAGEIVSGKMAIDENNLETSFLPLDSLTEEQARESEEEYADTEACADLEENVFAKDDESISWSSQIENDAICFQEYRENAGPMHTLPVDAKAVDFFKLFFTEEVCETLRFNTNDYAHFCEVEKGSADTSWSPVEDIAEIWAFVCVLLIMSIVRMPTLRDYWSSNPILGNNMIKAIMTRQRFEKLLHYFHISKRENELPRSDPQFDLMQKVEPLMSQLKDNFSKHFVPYKEIAIDEAMVKFKGRLGIVQYMPMKPAKRGLKVWMLCTSYLGYTMNFDVYCGKNDKVNRSGKGLGFDVVFHLLRKLQTRNNVVYFDRFFTSTDLLVHLWKKGFLACGTVTASRKKMPPEIRKIKLKDVGESVTFRCNEVPNLLCTTWMDRKQISVLSTNSKCLSTEVRRKSGAQVNYVTCPAAFNSYNKHMGGVDQADQKRKYYSVARKSTKWWHYIFRFLLDTAIDNAFIIQTVTNFPLQKRPKTLYQFKLELIEQLANGFTSRKRSATNSVEMMHEHKRVKISGRKRTCVRCRTNKIRTPSGRSVESSYECDICKVCLCKTCFPNA